MKKPTPKEKAEFLIKMFITVIVEEIICSEKIVIYTAVQCAIKSQEVLIVNLSDRSIVSEYEMEVLNQLKNVDHGN